MWNALEVLWDLIEWPLAGILWRSRLSRFFGVAFALVAVICLALAIFRSDSRWAGSAGAIVFGAMSFGVWQAGNWWQRRQETRPRPGDIPPAHRPGGFEVIIPTAKKSG